eukprot:jgi/Sobl393_1/13794/SZX78913.1
MLAVIVFALLFANIAAASSISRPSRTRPRRRIVAAQQDLACTTDFRQRITRGIVVAVEPSGTGSIATPAAPKYAPITAPT